MLLQVKWDSKGSYQLLFEKYEVKSCVPFGGDENWTLVIARLYKCTKNHLRLLWEGVEKRKHESEAAVSREAHTTDETQP